MKIATKKCDIHSDYLAKRLAKQKGVKNSEKLLSELRSKKFSELSNKEKDKLLMVLALRFGLILSD